MNFRNIIIVMLLALFGLIAFQWYWIENAIAVKKEQFDRDVNDAMLATVKKIEKQEVIFLANQQMKAQEQQKLLAITQHKIHRKRKPKPQFHEIQTEEIVVNEENAEKENHKIVLFTKRHDQPRNYDCPFRYFLGRTRF